MSTPDFRQIERQMSGSRALTDLRPLARLANLRQLDLSGCTAIIDLAPLATLSGLRRLEMFECPQVTDVSMLDGIVALDLVL